MSNFDLTPFVFQKQFRIPPCITFKEGKQVLEICFKLRRKKLYLFVIQNTMVSCPWDVQAVFIFVFCIPPIKYNVIRPLGCLIGRGENKGQLNNLIMGSIINPDWRKYIRFYFSIYQILSFLGHLLCSHMRWPDATAFCKSCDKYQRHDF